MKLKKGYILWLKQRVRELGRGSILLYGDFRIVAFNREADKYLIAVGGDEDDDEEFYLVSRDGIERVECFGGLPTHYDYREKIFAPSNTRKRGLIRKLEEYYSYSGFTFLIAEIEKGNIDFLARVIPVEDLGVPYMFLVDDSLVGEALFVYF